MKKLLLTTTMTCVLTIPCLAGSNTCEGLLKVGKEWTTVKGENGDFVPEGCRFLTSSKLGRRILTACPDGSDCTINVDLNHRSSIVTKIDSVWRNK